MVLGQRLAFWGGVALVSVLAQFALEAVTSRVPIPGLAQFTAFAHAHPSGA